MTGFVYVLIPVLMLITAVILGVGIFSLAQGGAFDKRNGNKLMRLRVAAQAITIGVMMLFLFLIGK